MLRPNGTPKIEFFYFALGKRSKWLRLVVTHLPSFVFQFSHVLSCFAQGMTNVQVPLNLKLWRTVGCHELLASLGFDLIGVGKDEVMLRSGKANSRRAVQCTVQALCALTGEFHACP